MLDEVNNAKECSDEEILAQSVTDPSVFEVLVSRYQGAFVRKAQTIIKRREDAEDIVQDAFVKIYLNAHRFESVPGASFKSWAYRILINTALTKYQKNKRHFGAVATLDPEIYDILPDKESQQFEKEELTEYVISILVRMPESMRRLLSLHFLEGRSQGEIADIEGASVGAIKTRVHRAKKEFRNIVKRLEVL